MSKERIRELEQELTVKQRLFVEAYFKNEYNASQAVRDAGYSCSNENSAKSMGCELLQKPKIKELVDLRAKAMAEDIKLKPEYVIRRLLRVIDKAEDDNNHNATLRGLELIARHLGMFIERTEITGKDGEAIQYEKVSNDAADFARAISSIASRGGAAEDPERTTH